MNEQRQRMIENQEEILRNQELMMDNEPFWEHFSDHLIIAFSFSSLGFIAGTYLIYYLYKKKIKIDYDIEEGEVMRVDRNNGKRLLVVRPENLMQVYDIILLSFFDRGKGKYIFKHDTKRIRIIRNVIIILMAILILSGVLLLLSALKMDMNPFNYIFK
ncbi:hypothetical protein BAOM_3013 [Peribacillus asahii]|uniref:Uncharacterized protein n=1 Tax=Peribacillus asahii TaxID=228899 RepID=A0A3Q9RP64_9BACI|nr:hypothetical protein [Peribacillus asahii]AZV43622.1 hypothetical protein BAOM_3013 [Peribacillus asahii]